VLSISRSVCGLADLLTVDAKPDLPSSTALKQPRGCISVDFNDAATAEAVIAIEQRSVRARQATSAHRATGVKCTEMDEMHHTLITYRFIISNQCLQRLCNCQVNQIICGRQSEHMD